MQIWCSVRAFKILIAYFKNIAARIIRLPNYRIAIDLCFICIFLHLNGTERN